MTVPVVETSCGLVSGLHERRVAIFRGIPYATAERFRPPASAPSWVGVRDGSSFGPPCPQVPGRPMPEGPSPIQREMAAGITLSSYDRRQPDEACLTLNVWTPATRAEPAAPVMVWLHGGGYHSQSASTPFSDGSALCTGGDVVVVTLNHRVGVLGYLYLDRLAPELFESTGNLGTLDILAALRWVHENISAFGGDPGRVTLFGYSGGAAKVTSVLGPAAEAGLVHRAIAQSGIDVRWRSPEDADRHAHRLAHAVGLNRSRIHSITTLPVKHILDAAIATSDAPTPGADWLPLDDGVTLNGDPLDALLRGRAASVPIVLGCTREETSFLLPCDATGAPHEAGRLRRLFAHIGSRAGPLVEGYRALGHATTDTDLFVAMSTDRVRVPLMRLAEARADHAAPTFVYEVDFPHPVCAGLYGATHTVDWPLVFGTFQYVPSMAEHPGASGVSASMLHAWASFAHGYEPGGSALPRWPPYTAAAPSTMVLDVEPSVTANRHRDVLELWRDDPLGDGGLVSRTP